jgi:hypothetical protein
MYLILNTWIQLNIKYLVHWLVIRRKYLKNAQ